VEIGPEGGRRHNSPLITLFPFEGKRPVASLGSGRRKSRHTSLLSILPFVYPYELLLLTGNKIESEGTLSKPKAKGFAGAFGALFSLVCPFHYKGFTIYRRPLGMVICLNYTFSVPDKRL
jgi:hypothetical protein